MSTRGIKCVGEEFAAFSVYLHEDRQSALEKIVMCGNGFEGWLKFEFYMWLCDHRGLTPHEHVGLEYKVALKAEGNSTLGPRKQCDMWVSSDIPERYHYVELKAPFANGNSAKMLRYAGWDAWYMSQLDWANPAVNAASGNAIVVGVGFTAAKWAAGRQIVCEAAGIATDTKPIYTDRIGASICWDVWTRSY